MRVVLGKTFMTADDQCGNRSECCRHYFTLSSSKAIVTLWAAATYLGSSVIKPFITWLLSENGNNRKPCAVAGVGRSDCTASGHITLAALNALNVLYKSALNYRKNH